MKGRFGKRMLVAALGTLLCVPVVLGVCSTCKDGEASSGLTGEEDASSLTYTALSEVTLADPYAVNALDKEIDYLLKLDADRLLADFYENAGLEHEKASYTGGWEGALIGGHTMGHYLTALAQAYQNVNVPADDRAAVLERIEYLVTELEKCQLPNGFLWGAKVINASNVEIQFDNVELGRANIVTQAWVPWYTMHKIIAGLIDVVNATGNETAKNVVCALGDWVYLRASGWSEATQKTVLSIEYGGMNDCMYNLYALTGEEDYAVAAHQFDEESLVDEIFRDRASYLVNKHANTTIPKVIGLLNGYLNLKANPVAGLEGVADDYLEAAELFWNCVVEHHTYVTGGNSEWEHFGMDDILNAERTNANCETCNTYNMLKLSRMLFTITKDVKYLDFYENTYYNAIWSSQNPETGMTTYFQPMATGYFKVYSSEEEHFWCCTGSGMESFTKLSDSIYYDAGNATYVSLYLDSTYQTDAVTLKQTASLETSDTVVFRVEKGETILRLRIPSWTLVYNMELNGSALSASETDGFVSVKVASGDELKVTFEKRITAHNLPDGPNVYAFKYGPFVLSAELGTENMTTGTTGVNVTVPTRAIGNATYSVPAEGTVQEFMAQIGSKMTVNGDGTFTLVCNNGTLTYSYHFRQYQQRYGIYFNFSQGEVVEQAVSNGWNRTDTVQPGYGQYENDELHALVDNGSVSVTNDGTYRYATEGGSFSYRMAVVKDVRNRLVVYFRKADNGKTIRITANGTEVYSETLAYTGDAAEYAVEVILPADVVETATGITANDTQYDVVTITFSGVDGAESAKVCSYLYSEALTNNVAYFVDCGDFDPTTVSEGDMLGLYNSVTEQVYGEDAVTGKTWGIYDTSETDLAAAKGHYPTDGKGVCTNSTWANEQVSADGVDKTVSNRYTKDQFENGVARNLHYKFELENGTYKVRMYFVDPWGVSASPNVTAEGAAALTGCAVATEVTFTVTVTDGVLDLDITSDALCINLAYIIIEFAD